MYRLQIKKIALIVYSLASVEHGVKGLEESDSVGQVVTGLSVQLESASTGHFNATCQSTEFAAVCSICHNLLGKCVSVTQFAHLLFFALVCSRRSDKLFQIE